MLGKILLLGIFLGFSSHASNYEMLKRDNIDKAYDSCENQLNKPDETLYVECISKMNESGLLQKWKIINDNYEIAYCKDGTLKILPGCLYCYLYKDSNAQNYQIFYPNYRIYGNLKPTIKKMVETLKKLITDKSTDNDYFMCEPK